MEESGGGGGDSDTVRVASSFEMVGERQRFTVELRPGETTIVSWKKLVKDAKKLNGHTSAPEPTPIAHPNLESHIAPVRLYLSSINQLCLVFCLWNWGNDHTVKLCSLPDLRFGS